MKLASAKDGHVFRRRALAIALAVASLFAALGPAGARFAGSASATSHPRADPGFAGTSIVSAAHPMTGALSATPTTPSVEATWPATAVVGMSVRGRQITLLRFGKAARRILIVGGVHGDEAGAPVAKEFAAYLKSHRSAVPRGTQVDILALANPDGIAAGRRGNARGVDLNRNFPSRTWRIIRTPGRTSGRYAGSEPETRAICRLLAAGKYARVVSLHSSGGMVDYAGPGGRAIAQRVARAAHTRLARIGEPGQFPGSMGHYVPERFGIPIVTWELSSRRLTAHVREGLVASLR